MGERPRVAIIEGDEHTRSSLARVPTDVWTGHATSSVWYASPCRPCELSAIHCVHASGTISGPATHAILLVDQVRQPVQQAADEDLLRRSSRRRSRGNVVRRCWRLAQLRMVGSVSRGSMGQWSALENPPIAGGGVPATQPAACVGTRPDIAEHSDRGEHVVAVCIIIAGACSSTTGHRRRKRHSNGLLGVAARGHRTGRASRF